MIKVWSSQERALLDIQKRSHGHLELILGSIAFWDLLQLIRMLCIQSDHYGHICIMTPSFHIIIVIVVVQVCGYRLRLHFDGYSDCHDFWVNANSADIHPPGWCESTEHKLQTPKGQSCHCSRHYLHTVTEQNKINSCKRTENMNFPSPDEINRWSW